MKQVLAVLVLIVAGLGSSAATVDTISIHSTAMNRSFRCVVITPDPEEEKQYPVVYLLHGYSGAYSNWISKVPSLKDFADEFGMIIVCPDGGYSSWYFDSPIDSTMRYETYVGREVPAYIDAHYRTIPARESRGLVGHSMGGYGASRIGMKHADVFGSLYVMSPCCMSPRGAGQPNPANEAAVAAATTREEIAKLPFGMRTQLAVASAWSPNPAKPPLYADLPFGDMRDNVLARWAANAPLAFIDQHIQDLRRYRAIAIDVGDQDGLKNDAARLHAILNSWSIANTFEVYPGTHTSHVAFRFQVHVLPFFSRTLSFDAR